VGQGVWLSDASASFFQGQPRSTCLVCQHSRVWAIFARQYGSLNTKAQSLTSPCPFEEKSSTQKVRSRRGEPPNRSVVNNFLYLVVPGGGGFEILLSAGGSPLSAEGSRRCELPRQVCLGAEGSYQVAKGGVERKASGDPRRGAGERVRGEEGAQRHPRGNKTAGVGMADNPLAGIIQQVDRNGNQINNFTDIGAPGGEFPPQNQFGKDMPSAGCLPKFEECSSCAIQCSARVCNGTFPSYLLAGSSTLILEWREPSLLWCP
jgi:hypothetical protein